MSRVRVAVIDSGVHAGHPHVNGISGGVSIAPDGTESEDIVDRIGHGTCVAAVIREKAPEAEIYAIKVFDRRLITSAQTLAHAIRWCARHHIDLINLSLGTSNTEHAGTLQAAVDEAAAAGCRLISAMEYLPGSLPGVTAVAVDYTCDRNQYWIENGVYIASGYPRPIPGVPPERNLKGVSFAVANVTGLLAQGYFEGPLAGVWS